MARRSILSQLFRQSAGYVINLLALFLIAYLLANEIRSIYVSPHGGSKVLEVVEYWLSDSA